MAPSTDREMAVMMRCESTPFVIKCNDDSYFIVPRSMSISHLWQINVVYCVTRTISVSETFREAPGEALLHPSPQYLAHLPHISMRLAAFEISFKKN